MASLIYGDLTLFPTILNILKDKLSERTVQKGENDFKESIFH